MCTPAGRLSGVLAHVSALPGPMGCGEFGSETFEFVKLLKAAGQRLWQVLPLGPTDTAPYSAKSSFAIHPVYISLQSLADDLPFLLDASSVLRAYADCSKAAASSDDLPCAVGNSRFVDFDKVWRIKQTALKQVASTFFGAPPNTAAEVCALNSAYEEFCAEHSAAWLDTYALFAVLDDKMKSQQGPYVWNEWPEPLRSCEGNLTAEQKEAAGVSDADIEFHKFLQFIVYRQWHAIRKVAHELDVAIVGDCAIYPSMHSADVWANPGIFQIDRTTKLPSAVAGVPPDYFSEDGQLWGNPLYDWDASASTGHHWWCERMRVTLLQVDLLRIDHFRGLESYYAVPYGHATSARNARVGEWRKAAGQDMLAAVVKKLHGDHALLSNTTGSTKRPSLTAAVGDPPSAKKAKLDAAGGSKPAGTPTACITPKGGGALSALKVVSPPYIVEDLGFITDEVKQLTAHFGFPNMKVLQFAFAGGTTGSKSYCENDHLPHSFKTHSVVYPGTHDNATAVGWWNSADTLTKENFADYCGCPGKELTSVEANAKLQALCMQSVAALCIIPLQDVLNLNDREGRFNDPANGSWPQNWRWQLASFADLGPHLAALHALTLATGRCWR